MAKLIRCPKCGQRVTWVPSDMILMGTKKETCGCDANRDKGNRELPKSFSQNMMQRNIQQNRNR